MFGLGMPELIVILVILLLVFGVGKLPQVGDGLGKAIRGFRRSVSEPDSPDSQKPDSDKTHSPGDSTNKTGEGGT
ncbi:MAG TPA: twin-arginine translocase TatA/TatE family subunit [Nitrospiria bacterium]